LGLGQHQPHQFQRYLPGIQQRHTADTYKYHNAILQPNWDDFAAAATTELHTLEQMGIWEKVPMSAAPSGKKGLGGTWLFKRKCAPDFTILKRKARCCVQGTSRLQEKTILRRMHL
jgi:hypothetical protein